MKKLLYILFILTLTVNAGEQEQIDKLKYDLIQIQLELISDIENSKAIDHAKIVEDYESKREIIEKQIDILESTLDKKENLKQKK